MRRLAVALLAVVVACSDERPSNSTDIATGDFGLSLTLRGTATTTNVVGAVLGPGPSPRIVDGDRVELRTPLGTIPVGLVDGKFGYDLPAVGGDFELALVRAPGRGGDLSNKVFLAPPFAIRVPVTASRADAFTMTWDAAVGPHELRLSVDGKCVAKVQRTLADVGTYTFNKFELASSAAAPGTCTVTIGMVKVWSPSNPSYYQATQTATSVTLEMTP